VSGWAQYAGWQTGRRKVQFALYASRYQAGTRSDGASWSRAAFDDLLRATRAQGYRPLRDYSGFRPATSGRSIVEIQRSGSMDLVVMALTVGPVEVEAIAVFDHRSHTARQIALEDLSRQVEVAARSGS
jgi:hypothetical protein